MVNLFVDDVVVDVENMEGAPHRDAPAGCGSSSVRQVLRDKASGCRTRHTGDERLCCLPLTHQVVAAPILRVADAASFCRYGWRLA